MNWTKKPKMRRVKERFLQALGVHQQSSYPEFDERLKHFSDLMSALHQIYDSMEIFMELIDSISQVMLNLTDSFLNLYSKSISKQKAFSPMNDLAKSFQLLSSIYKDIHDSVNPQLKIVFEDRCMLPIKSMLTQEDIIKAKYHERNKIVLEYDSVTSAAKAELAAGKDETHPNVIKLQTKVDAATIALNNIHEDINQSLDDFERHYPTVLSPCFAAIVGCSYHHGTTSDNLLNKMIPYLPETASTICALSYVASVHTISTSNQSATLKTTSHTAHALANMQDLAIAHLVERQGSGSGDDLLTLAIGTDGPPSPISPAGGTHRRSTLSLTRSEDGKHTDESVHTSFRKAVVDQTEMGSSRRPSVEVSEGPSHAVTAADIGRSVRGALPVSSHTITDTKSTLGSLAASHMHSSAAGYARANSEKIPGRSSRATDVAAEHSGSVKDAFSPHSRLNTRSSSLFSADTGSGREAGFSPDASQQRSGAAMGGRTLPNG